MKITSIQKKEYNLFLEAIDIFPESHSKFALINANSCYKRAWKFKKRDPNISRFLLITAEEEAATSIILALKEQKYNNMKDIKYHDHSIKTGVYVFYGEVHKFLSNKFPDIHVEKKIVHDLKYPRIIIYHSKSDFSPNVKIKTDSPFIFPFELNGTIESFQEDILNYINIESFFKTISDHTKHRNDILYASQYGIPYIKPENLLTQFPIYYQRLAQYLMLFLCIKPYKDHQPLLQQLIDTFVELNKRRYNSHQ
ncbi:MAG: hypothetical protein GF353_23600 [Candidatus Lokiarchaeota archaeon]|nr:hypothetical protein [Candidatus Lokiarchaeota archaeon]